MLVFNSTYIIDREKGCEFLEWFAPLAHKAGPEGRAHLAVLRGGLDRLDKLDGLDGLDESDRQEPLSVAFQVEFDSRQEMNKWIASRFRPLAAAFERRYTPPGMIFTSISERIF